MTCNWSVEVGIASNRYLPSDGESKIEIVQTACQDKKIKMNKDKSFIIFLYFKSIILSFYNQV